MELLTLVLLNKLGYNAHFYFQPIRLLDLDFWLKFTYLMTNSADPDQLASSEDNWSGATLFAKTGHVVFSKRKVNYWFSNYTETNDRSFQWFYLPINPMKALSLTVPMWKAVSLLILYFMLSSDQYCNFSNSKSILQYHLKWMYDTTKSVLEIYFIISLT